jgi:hypothetical protein
MENGGERRSIPRRCGERVEKWRRNGGERKVHGGGRVLLGFGNRKE